MYHAFERRGAAAGLMFLTGLAICLTGVSGAARADSWGAVLLGSGVPGLNYANAVTPLGGFQVGASEDANGLPTPYYWTGNAASATTATPVGYDGGIIETVSFSSGKLIFGGSLVPPGEQTSHAAFWTPGGPVTDLHPANADFSTLTSLSRDSAAQTGVYDAPNSFGNMATHAGLWNGTADSLIDLTPDGAVGASSYAISGDGATQGGSVDDGGADLKPGTWSGTPDSFVDLTPDGYVGGEVYALSGDGAIQAGYVDNPAFDQLAGYWNGSASSFVLLDPPTWDFSNVNAASADGQVFVGYGYDNDITQAEIHGLYWTAAGGSAGFVDLHQYLPAEFSDSVAYGVTHFNGISYITGEAFRPDGSEVAVLWRHSDISAPEPGTLTLGALGIGCWVAITSFWTVLRRKRA